MDRIASSGGGGGAGAGVALSWEWVRVLLVDLRADLPGHMLAVTLLPLTGGNQLASTGDVTVTSHSPSPPPLSVPG